MNKILFYIFRQGRKLEQIGRKIIHNDTYNALGEITQQLLVNQSRGMFIRATHKEKNEMSA